MMAYTKRDRRDSKFGRDVHKNFGNFLGRGAIDPGGYGKARSGRVDKLRKYNNA
jgi:hypothetical protein